MCRDPRTIIDYGKYVGKKDSKDSIGSWIAFLAAYAGLIVVDSGQACAGGYRYVPVFEFTAPDIGPVSYDYARYNELVDDYEREQAKFLKAIVLNEKFDSDDYFA